MAQAYGTANLQSARRYWLERTPFTTVISSLAPGQTTTVFSLQGWNPGSSTDMVATLLSLGITQYPNLQVTVTADGQSYRYFADEFPPALEQVLMGHSAVRNLSLQLTNLSTSATMTNIQALYVAQSWRAPVAYKQLHGYALTADEQRVARAAGLAPNPALDVGLYPLPLDFIIERSYVNRRISPWLRLAQPIVLAQAGVPQTIDQIQARPNELLVLFRIGVDADFDDGVTLIVDRDNDSSYLQLNADQLSIRSPLPLLLPALNHLTPKLQAASVPAAPVPVRLDLLRVSLSLILDLRLGLITQGQLTQAYQRLLADRGVSGQALGQRAVENAATLVADVAAGVR
jgi:hypothetical protein